MQRPTPACHLRSCKLWSRRLFESSAQRHRLGPTAAVAGLQVPYGNPGHLRARQQVAMWCLLQMESIVTSIN